MTADFKINIFRCRFSADEVFYPRKKIFESNLGVDWCVSAKPVKKLETKKFESLRNLSFLSNRIRMTVSYNGLPRTVLAEVKILQREHLKNLTTLQLSLTQQPTKSDTTADPVYQNMIFHHICEKGNNSVKSEVKVDSTADVTWRNLVCEFSLYVSPENFFYFQFTDDNTLVEASVTESSKYITDELISDFNELYKKQDFADVDIKCGEEVFKAHKVVLSARSPVFAAMFQHKMKESEENVIDIKDMDSNVLSIFLEFIYCGKLDRLSAQTAGDLLSAAEQYQLAGLKKACVSFLHCTMSSDNVLSTLSLADLHDSGLRKISIDFVSKEFDQIKNTEEWKRFQKEKPVLANEVLLNIIGFASGYGYKLCQ